MVKILCLRSWVSMLAVGTSASASQAESYSADVLMATHDLIIANSRVGTGQNGPFRPAPERRGTPGHAARVSGR